jgi:hypothetical protein
MEEQFIPYPLALRMKQLGFDEPCFGYYDGNHNLQFMYNGKPECFSDRRMGVSGCMSVGWTSAPLWQQAFSWFRKNHDYAGSVIRDEESPNELLWCTVITETTLYEGEGTISLGISCDTYKSYEEAQLACLEELIKIVELKEK